MGTRDDAEQIFNGLVAELRQPLLEINLLAATGGSSKMIEALSIQALRLYDDYTDLKMQTNQPALLSPSLLSAEVDDAVSQIAELARLHRKKIDKVYGREKLVGLNRGLFAAAVRSILFGLITSDTSRIKLEVRGGQYPSLRFYKDGFAVTQSDIDQSPNNYRGPAMAQQVGVTTGLLVGARLLELQGSELKVSSNQHGCQLVAKFRPSQQLSLIEV